MWQRLEMRCYAHASGSHRAVDRSSSSDDLPGGGNAVPQENGYKAVEVSDGPRDAGSDLALYLLGNNPEPLAVQVSVQKAGWERKIRQDAQRAIDLLGRRHFLASVADLSCVAEPALPAQPVQTCCHGDPSCDGPVVLGLPPLNCPAWSGKQNHLRASTGVSAPRHVTWGGCGARLAVPLVARGHRAWLPARQLQRACQFRLQSAGRQLPARG